MMSQAQARIEAGKRLAGFVGRGSDGQPDEDQAEHDECDDGFHMSTVSLGVGRARRKSATDRHPDLSLLSLSGLS